MQQLYEIYVKPLSFILELAHSFDVLTNSTVTYYSFPTYPCNGLCTADVNECARGTDRCHPHATCHNTQGSYTCSCNAGYTGNGYSCTGKCRYVLSLLIASFQSTHTIIHQTGCIFSAGSECSQPVFPHGSLYA